MSSQTINNARTISGLFREAILTNVNVQVNELIAARIYSVKENDRREPNETRSIIIMPGTSSIRAGDRASVQLRFPDFLIKCEVECESSDAESFACTMPSSVEMIDHRSARRLSTTKLDLQSSTALLTGNGYHYEVDFRLDNISRFGYAGEVELDAKNKIEPGFMISGKSFLDNGQINLDGLVVDLKEIQRTGDRRRLFIRVLRQDHMNRRGSVLLDRDQSRMQGEKRLVNGNCNFTISVKSPLNPNLNLELEVYKVSVSAFLAKFARSEMQNYIVPGLPVILKDTSLVAEVLESEFGTVNAQWVSGSEHDRVNWLKKISAFLADGVSTSVSDAGDLLAIFCQSGAFSSEFLRTQRHRFHSIVDNIESESSSSSYVHRWVDRSNEDKSFGHISCIRVGDNAWFATDLVKSAKEARLRGGFVKKFFLSFSQFACTLRPVPRVLLIWVKGHPFWRDLEGQLTHETPPMAVRLKIGYLRLSTESIDENVSSRISALEIRAEDYQKIEQVHHEIGDDDVSVLARVFDFCIDRISSEKLTQAVQKDGKIFWRRYFEIRSEQCGGLAVVTSAPDGMNPNRVVDGIWFFEFKTSKLNSDDEWIDICAFLREISARMGISISGIRRVKSAAYFSKLAVEDAEMIGYVVHPSLLQMFG